MLPSRFQVSPESEISASRPTFPSTIHFCRVVSSRQTKTLPLVWRTFHSRDGGGGGSSLTSCAPWASSGFTGRVITISLRLTRKTWAHCVHLTVTPSVGTRASSSSYSVLQRGQLTSIRGPYTGEGKRSKNCGVP